jgi:hypothetical protein
MRIDLEAHFGRTAHLIEVSSLKAFIEAFNTQIGRDGLPIDAVVFHFHMNSSTMAMKNIDGTWADMFRISDMGGLTNSRDIPFLYFGGCQAGNPNNGISIAGEFARISNIGLVVASDVNTNHNVNRSNYMSQLVEAGIRSDGSTNWQLGGPGFRVFWSGAYSFPRISNSFGNMGDLIRSARDVKAVGR